MSIVKIKSLSAPPVNLREIQRYAGASRSDDPEIRALIESALSEAEAHLEYKLCYTELECRTDGDICDFGVFSVRSAALAKNLSGSRSVLLFAATVGVGLDRLIAKQSALSPARALMLDSIGGERIEALCDAFCRDYEAERGVSLKPRFSAGYGDLPLETQREIFSTLSPGKNIGLFLNASLSMSPSKSVTAFAGIQ